MTAVGCVLTINFSYKDVSSGVMQTKTFGEQT